MDDTPPTTRGHRVTLPDGFLTLPPSMTEALPRAAAAAGGQADRAAAAAGRRVAADRRRRRRRRRPRRPPRRAAAAAGRRRRRRVAPAKRTAPPPPPARSRPAGVSSRRPARGAAEKVLVVAEGTCFRARLSRAAGEGLGVTVKSTSDGRIVVHALPRGGPSARQARASGVGDEVLGIGDGFFPPGTTLNELVATIRAADADVAVRVDTARLRPALCVRILGTDYADDHTVYILWVLDVRGRSGDALALQRFWACEAARRSLELLERNPDITLRQAAQVAVCQVLALPAFEKILADILYRIEHPGTENHLGADDFPTIFIYVLVNADIPNLSYLQKVLCTLCDPDKRLSETGYYVATFEAAVQHILELDVS
ncbi:vacuolar sorting protein 9 (VPS9) domain containing protein [Aureococcus anophagefferens]|nr:vacuolar sorting protein 9 (VPS9) domain containing protein [Aureococcus anophagefferens]